MVIKFKGCFDDKIVKKDGSASWPAKRVEGTKIKDNSPYEKKIFANAKDLREQLEQFGIGDHVKVVNVKEGSMWKVKEFRLATAEEIEKAKEGYTPQQYGSGGGSSSGSGWKGRTGEAYDRSAAIYLAADVIKHNASIATKKEEKVIRIDDIAELAKDIYDYIHDGKNLNEGTQEKSLDELEDEIA